MNKRLNQNRPAYVEINRQALKHNLHKLKQITPNADVMAVIKANGYGHDIEVVADALNQADCLAVNNLDDLHRLRAHGITCAVTILSTRYSAVELSTLSELNAQPVIYNTQQLALLAHYKGAELSIWLKFDSGMGRLGFLPEEAEEVRRRIDGCPALGEVGIMTHFANAEDSSHLLNEQQLTQFKLLTAQFPAARKSLLNSAGIINYADYAYDVVRPGIALYGISPIENKTGVQLGLQPAMTFKSVLLSVKTLPVGHGVGYGSTTICQSATQVGVVACGYADGYPRHATDTPVLVNGKLVKLIGRPSMDMITVDLTGMDVAVGDDVILWGDGLPVEWVAESAETIAYELVCAITQRVQRIVV